MMPATAMFCLLMNIEVHGEDIADDSSCTITTKTSAAVSFSNQKVASGGLMFQTVYREQEWAGDLIAVCIDGSGDPVPCKCASAEGAEEPCQNPFDPDRPEIKWSADGLAGESDEDFWGIVDDGWWKQRSVITYNDVSKSGVPLLYDNLSNRQRNLLRNDPDLVSYLRGDRSLEEIRFRKRFSYYGDFINFVPTGYSTVLLVGSNGGMLHVFDEDSGHEYFSYVPGSVYAAWVDETVETGAYQENLAVLGDETYRENHLYFVDGGVSVQYLEDQLTTLAAGSLGRGGKGIYALNLFGMREMEHVESHADRIVMWEYPDPSVDRLHIVDGKLVAVPLNEDESADSYSDTVTSLAADPYLGNVYGSPQIVKLPQPEAPGYRWAVVFGNGYGSYHQVPVLYALDAYDGSVIRRIVTMEPGSLLNPVVPEDCDDEYGCNGLSMPELVDADDDGIIDYAYAGDLLGNVWKFDFTGGFIFGTDGYSAAFYDSGDLDTAGNPAPKPLISVRDKQGRPQPITTKPTVTYSCNGSGSGLMVMFGTGLPDRTEDNGQHTQTVYGIWDWQDEWKIDMQYGIEPAAAYYGNLETMEPSTSMTETCSAIARGDCEVNCKAGCIAEQKTCETGCFELQGDDLIRESCISDCNLVHNVCQVECAGHCLTAADSGFDTSSCEAQCESELSQCLTEAVNEIQEGECHDRYGGRIDSCAPYWDTYIGCSSRRTLSNVAAILSTDQAESITLLEQRQLLLGGLRFYDEADPEVVGGQAAPGDIKEIDDVVVDFDAYDRVVRMMSDYPIRWFTPDDLENGLAETQHVGWFFDLPTGGEYLAAEPVVLDGVLYYSTFIPSLDPCGGGNSMVMGHNSCSGGRGVETVFDINGDEMLSSRDSVVLFDLGDAGESDQVSGFVSSESVSAPTIIAAQNQDFLFMPKFESVEASADIENSIVSVWYPPDVAKTVTRGKNLGVYFWRELF